jgi:hypothetical protein
MHPMRELNMSEPYSFINRQMQTYASVRLAVAQAGHSMSKFDVLNAHIRNAVVLPGELVIIPDDTSTSCTGQEAYLMRKATEVHLALVTNGMQGDGFLIENYDTLQDILDKTSVAIGSGTEGWSRHLHGIKKTLEDIQQFHKEYRASSSPNARDTFFKKRQLAYAELDKQLKNYASAGSGLRNNCSIKRMLGISMKSFMSTGEIDGYAARIAGVARASQVIKRAGWIGVGLDAASSGFEIREACTAGDEDRCEKAWYVEGGKLAGGLAAGAFAGYFSATAASYGCVVVLGLATGGPGALACGVIVGGTLAYAGGTVGAMGGERTGELIYKMSGK